MRKHAKYLQAQPGNGISIGTLIDKGYHRAIPNWKRSWEI